MCTGNICRSALATVLMRGRLRDLPVTIFSAGTHAMVGEGLPAEQREIARGRGGSDSEIDAHAAQQLQEPHVLDATLVIGMAHDHRRYAMQLVPGHLKRIFTATEFARLAAGVDDSAVLDAVGQATSPEARLLAAVEMIAARRAAGDDDPDVVDPYRRPADVYEASAAQLDPVLQQLERIARLTLSGAGAQPDQGARMI